ncbi:MAG: alanine--tRNA ligase [Bacteroidia bacterium]|nr:alanine--tRNA ligase [Bacteroidia bacterium]
MNSKEIRKAFIDFFNSKEHAFVPSAPMVVKNDPTLMFTNAGMNQFKDIFLGNSPAKYPRVANSQKCLRVSGKHNDLEEVGHDTYHHTMFEMLGNWSFGNYFKKEAIDWAWEFLTEKLKIDKRYLYATVFEGSPAENIEADKEALEFWKKYLPEDHIIFGNKKDNFWEMGDTGPCGPCSEIHIDLRDDSERNKVPGASLVNTGHSLVIEIWNLVFIQFNRKADGALESLPAKHVDTGMGFERLCMVVQDKKSNYDTDVFQTIISEIGNLSNKKYGVKVSDDIAMRVIADHLRAVSFSIADGQLPSNTGAGYVIRRILRRAIRYGYTFLGFNEPFIYKLVAVLESNMGEYFKELQSQKAFIAKVIQEEEISFLRTLETGIQKFEGYILKEKNNLAKTKVIPGNFAFELFDTFGFPLDLTQILARENELSVDTKSFDECLKQQKDRSRSASVVETGDWTILKQIEKTEFVGYDETSVTTEIIKYRKVEQKGKSYYQVVLAKTPFYGESGGQLGDTGWIEWNGNKLEVVDTKKENNLTNHILNELPNGFSGECVAIVDNSRRNRTQENHSATHLLHFALRKVLGNHVEQKGSLVGPDHLRFDFSHMQKMSAEEVEAVEVLVNEMIRKGIVLTESRSIPIEEAKELGAMALFSEKYEDHVRVIKFGESIELCGGTHVENTAKIGLFKILSEASIATGIRRVEAVTGEKAVTYYKNIESQMLQIKELLKNPKEILKSVESLIADNEKLSKSLDGFLKEKSIQIKNEIKQQIVSSNGLNTAFCKISIPDLSLLRDIAFQLKAETENLFLVMGTEIEGKAHVAVFISDNLVKERNLHAGNIIKDISKEINGGGGGQPFFATAGGTKPEGIHSAFLSAEKYIK